MDFNQASIDLNTGISDLLNLNRDLNRRVEQFTGQPIPTQIDQSTVRNKKAIIWQIDGLPDKLKVPDLIIRLNPNSLKSDFAQLINRKRTYGGFIEEHWGEQLDSLSMDSLTSSFYGASGLTSINRRDTDAYREFNELVSIYRNNGSIYDPQSRKLIAQGTIVMNYDFAIYQGFFERFSISDTADKPFDLKFSFSFKVTQELYPGRARSFRQITPTAIGASRNENISMDILNT